MPSEKILEQKKQVVADLTDTLNNACAGVLVDYKGTNVADDTKLRKELREANITYSVVKNTLLNFAAKNANLEGLGDVLAGTTAIATSTDDHVAAARILSKFSDTHKNFSIKSGFLDGSVISLEKITSLAKLPSRDILLATVCNAFNAPIASFARAIQAIVDKQGEDVVSAVTEVVEETPVEAAAAETVPTEATSVEAPVAETPATEAPAEEA
ncbi:MAG: 50S ribosomal protein L10 [Oscillospiraceae bacterium]|nr:50S ribosomal protein L10 [Oscillospiraceae bacterium]